jgi:hypothetical protein
MLKTMDILRITAKAAHQMSALWIAAVDSTRRLLGSQFDVFLKRSNLLFSNFSRSLALISSRPFRPQLSCCSNVFGLAMPLVF